MSTYTYTKPILDLNFLSIRHEIKNLQFVSTKKSTKSVLS